mmetsp:Transcript_27976/g.5107  ORF Transcript_27976/g.5107 Transcript_27976/m.5107 type:complete len:88 (+) Transcript_27976:3405-3668(+)
MPSINAKNYVYCNKQYTSATVSGDVLTLVLAEEVAASSDSIEIYIQAGLDNPAASTSVGFLFKTSYLDIVFDEDTQINASESHALNV